MRSAIEKWPQPRGLGRGSYVRVFASLAAAAWAAAEGCSSEAARPVETTAVLSQDLTGASWSVCVNRTTTYASCSQYCGSVGMVGDNSCTTSRGYPNWGAEAWPKGSYCAGTAGGQTTTDFLWDDNVGDVPRWKCCCAPAPPAWSACVGRTASYGSCNQYCASVGKACSQTCTTSRGYPNWGAEAWFAGQMCGGSGAGQQTCAFAWDDSVDAPPRWKCCCGGATSVTVQGTPVVNPLVQQYGPGSVFTVKFNFTTTVDPATLTAVTTASGSTTGVPIDNNHGLPASYRPAPFTFASIGGGVYSGVITWQTQTSTAAGSYQIGLRDATGFVDSIASIQITSSAWMHIYGDGAAGNVNIVFTGDRWPTQDAYLANVLKNSQDFINGDPLIRNYAPSINLAAKRSITGLNCHKCRGVGGGWDTDCGLDPLAVDAENLAAAVGSILNPWLIPIALIIDTAEYVATNVANSRADIFTCSVSSVRSSVSDAPNGHDVIVAYASAGGSYPSDWWRSNDGNISVDLNTGLKQLFGDDWPDRDIIFQATYAPETAQLAYANSTWLDGPTLEHEFGHAFAKLPDFYNWDDTCAKYQGKMCSQQYSYASPRPPGWYGSPAGYNKAWDKVAMVDAFNRRVGGITSITTGNTFPNPNDYPADCEAKKFQVTYQANPKQLAFVNGRIFDVQGRRLYEYSSETPVPNSTATMYFGFRSIDQSWTPQNLAYGYPGVIYAEGNTDFNLLASELYFFSIFAGDVQSAAGDGNKFTWFSKPLMPITAVVCSPQP